MRILLVLLLLVTSCAGAQNTYTYQKQVTAGTKIDLPLYSVRVPRLSVFEEYPAKEASWERYTRDGNPDDLILKEGYEYSSYAVSANVNRKPGKIQTIEDLKKHVIVRNYTKPIIYRQSNPDLVCVKPQVIIEDVGDRPLFAMHVLSCLDKRTGYYYELNISFMTRRRDWFPSQDLELEAKYLFDSFSVKQK